MWSTRTSDPRVAHQEVAHNAPATSAAAPCRGPVSQGWAWWPPVPSGTAQSACERATAVTAQRTQTARHNGAGKTALATRTLLIGLIPRRIGSVRVASAVFP